MPQSFTSTSTSTSTFYPKDIYLLPMGLVQPAIELARNPKTSRWLSPLLLLVDAILCGLIIWKVPYTEIDWKAYMEQVATYLSGERDYTAIKGATGPLVYPAAHLYIYSLLFYLTDGGNNILLAQMLFGGLYLATLALVLACYRKAEVPPYIFPLLILSKRLHSIFLLRLFNDCFAVAALFLAIYAYQRRVWTVGSIAYSWGVGTKMTLLLAAPAIGIILFQALPLKRSLNAAFLIAQVQIALALPFLSINASGYIGRAFEFSRQFLWKWTVNWRFIGEEVFLSRKFSLMLAMSNLCLLFLFFSTRWIRPSAPSLPAFIATILKPISPKAQQLTSLRITPSFILTAILSSTIIGTLCARSLHYQFYVYVVWSTPYLLWRSGMHPLLIYTVWAAQEWAWNVYPSTESSSIIVVGSLGLQVLGAWWGTRGEFANVKLPNENSNDGHQHVE